MQVLEIPVGTTGWNQANLEAHWTESAWQKVSSPIDETDFATDVTSEYTDYLTPPYGQRPTMER